MRANIRAGFYCLLLSVTACSENTADKDATQQDVKALISAVEKMQSKQTAPPPPTATVAGRKSLGGINVAVPAGWQQATPASSMRVAEYHMAGARPQDQEATLAIFAGKMGTVEANIDRWFGQFAPPTGATKGQQGRRWEQQVDGMDAVLIDISGTYAPNMGMNQATDTSPATDYRMLGAIVDFGPKYFYFKLTGPKDTVALWAPSFIEFINNIQKD